MVFVHARNATVATALKLLELAQKQVMIEGASHLPTTLSREYLFQFLIAKNFCSFCFCLIHSGGHMSLFDCSELPGFDEGKRAMQRSRNSQLRDLFYRGFAVHHAGQVFYWTVFFQG